MSVMQVLTSITFGEATVICLLSAVLVRQGRK